MHHAIAVGKELCLGFVWGMFIVFFQISTVIIYEYTDIPAFKFFAALHPYNLSVMIRVEPFARPRSYCCRYDEQLAAEKQRTERVTKRILTEEEMSALSDRLMQVTKGMTITVRYFKEDTAHPEVPAVGNYITLTGKADRIDPVFRTLQVGDTVVPFEDLVEVSGNDILDIDAYLGIGEE